MRPKAFLLHGLLRQRSFSSWYNAGEPPRLGNPAAIQAADRAQSARALQGRLPSATLHTSFFAQIRHWAGIFNRSAMANRLVIEGTRRPVSQ